MSRGQLNNWSLFIVHESISCKPVDNFLNKGVVKGEAKGDKDLPKPLGGMGSLAVIKIV